MRDFKDSGIEWIGEIPKEWEVIRLQFCLQEINHKNIPIKTEQILSLVKNKGVMLYEEKGNQGNKAKENLKDYKLAYPNTLVLNSMNILIGSVGISEYFGCVSPVYYVFKENKNSDLRYINYIFNTTEFQRELKKYANGILEIRLRISIFDILKRKIPFPPLETQIKIANFLDKKCDNINLIKDKILNQIANLGELKKSIITKAVTKGLDKNVKFKDSKIEWIGEIPTHWQISKVKYVSDIRNKKYEKRYGNLNYFSLENIISWSSKFISTENEYDLENSVLCYKGDIVLGKLRPYLAKTFLVDYDRCCSSEFAVFYNFKGVSKFYLYCFTSQGFIEKINLSTHGVKMPRANIEFIKNVSISIPPLNEQIEISNYLDEKCVKIDEIINLKNKELEILDEYKNSLIYECVTGKKEIK